MSYSTRITPHFMRAIRQNGTIASRRPLFFNATTTIRPFSISAKAMRGPPKAPAQEADNLRTGNEAPTFLGTQKRLPEFNLVDRVVLVSGGARGLGLAQSEALLEAGAKVYALDRLEKPSPEFYQVQAKAQKDLGTSLHYHQIDVRDEVNLNKTIEKIGKENGRLDGLIAAAGIQQETTAFDYNAADFNRMLEVNVTGVFLTAQAAAKQMVKFGNGGSIVMIASMSGTIANKGLACPAYNTSKSAVLQLARNLAAEWGVHGIRVNTISPGYILTAMVEDLFVKFPERKAEWSTQNMLGRLSQPKEYRGAAVFLLSDASTYMTGADLIMDGGHHSW
ncbi:hypothetical protein DFP73DRAFT_502608 [Morchella snyderi]|nr:hypothetical protein DFP73DRAFT_502608 [Morchella snyderi]